LEQLPVFSRAVANQLFGLLFPPVCTRCDRRVAEAGTLCGVCWFRVRFIDGANERKLNVRGAFKVPDTQEIKVRGRNVLLIDNV
jgi:predicted amidophosphoribosyltransferase